MPHIFKNTERIEHLRGYIKRRVANTYYKRHPKKSRKSRTKDGEAELTVKALSCLGDSF